MHVTVPLTLAQATLGATVSVPTLHGEVDLTVKPGSQPGVRKVMKGKGIKKVNLQAHGDQYVEFKVEVPTKCSPRMMELMKEFEAELEASDSKTTAQKAYDVNLERMRKQQNKK